MKRLFLAASALGGIFLLAGDLSGHGGTYRGPGDTVPPGEGAGPGTGGPNNGGPTTPGPGGPGTPGPGGGPATPGTGPGAPGGGGGGPRGPVTGGGFGGKKNKPGEGFEQWQFWWENNKDRFLDLRNRLGSGAVQSGGAAFLTGLGRKEATNTSKRPSADEVNAQLVPILRGVLGEDDADIVDSAVLAMGRMVKKESASLVLEDIRGSLANKNLTVKQSAILSLGVLGSVDAVPDLIEILGDTQKGRSLLDERGSIQSLQRAFAAASLGYIGSPETAEVLMEAIKDNKNSEIDIRSMSILALGMFTERKEEIVQFLAELLKDSKMDRTTAAQVPVALARLAPESAPLVPELLKLAKGRKTDIRMAESCVIALGELATPDDTEVLEELYDIIKESKNQQARHFAFIALSQIGGIAAKNEADHADLLANMNKFLLKELAKPKKKTHRPWAGLSLALLGRAYDQNSNTRVQIMSKLIEAFEDSNNPLHKSAFAIGLGLLNARASGEMLYEELLDTHDLNLKGYLAVSLGMMRHSDSLETLRKLVLDDRDPKLRLQVATSLGLQGDVEAVPILLEALKEATTLNVISSMARAIGLIGDKSAIQQLGDLVNDKRAPGLARAFGCAAIGLIGEKTILPWNVRLAEGANYRTVVPALYEILDIL